LGLKVVCPAADKKRWVSQTDFFSRGQHIPQQKPDREKPDREKSDRGNPAAELDLRIDCATELRGVRTAAAPAYNRD
jgi:hypothetical protein